MTDLDDFEQQNQITRYRNRLDDIREWRGQLHDIMLTISSYSMDLANVRGTTSRIPGGDALAMLGPWAADADHGDDLPHPDQIVREWVHTLTEEPRRTWAENWRWLFDQVPWILGTPWADQWRADIDALWHRLERLSGNSEKEEQHQRGTEDCRARAHEIPDDHRITLSESVSFWPNVRNRVEVDRHRERTQAKKKKQPPNYRCNPDEKGRYLVADLREHYGAKRDEEEHQKRMTSM